MPTDCPMLHDEWASCLIRLQRAGLLRRLGVAEAERLLARDAEHAPSRVALATLLRRWYGADGDWVEALWRRQRDGYVEVFRAQPPGDVATAVVHAVPALEGLRAVVTPSALVVELDDDRVTVSRVVRHARLRDREKRRALSSPEHVIHAVNVLLSRRDHAARFVEVIAERDRAAFVATSLAAARELWRVAATPAREIDAVLAAAAWDRDGAPRRAAG